MYLLLKKKDVELLLRKKHITQMPEKGMDGVLLPTGAKVVHLSQKKKRRSYMVQGYHFSGADIVPYAGTL